MRRSYYDLPIGSNYPEYVNCVVEISTDTNAKYEYNTEMDVFVLDRCLISSMRYPANYGFVPQTIADDGDPLDVLIHNSVRLQTGTLVECRIVGVLDMTDSGVKDYKLLGIPRYNPNNYNDITDIDSMFLTISKDFFKHYKNIEGKTVLVGDWMGKDTAHMITKASHANYMVKV